MTKSRNNIIFMIENISINIKQIGIIIPSYIASISVNIHHHRMRL
jgi:hypothetical protein